MIEVSRIKVPIAKVPLRAQVMVGALGLATLIAWWLASPGSVSGKLDDRHQSLLPEFPPMRTQDQLLAALDTLYQRQAWSAVRPSGQTENDDHGQQPGDAGKAVPKPEGLDRFRLLGVIQVRGEPAEALLLDVASKQGPAQSNFLALEGERLQETQVRIQRIEPARILLRLAGQERWLPLFPEPDDNTTNEQ